jgi:hypothetical protein
MVFQINKKLKLSLKIVPIEKIQNFNFFQKLNFWNRII